MRRRAHFSVSPVNKNIFVAFFTHGRRRKLAGGEREERRIRHAGFGFNFCANDAFAEEPSEKEAYVIVLRSPQVRHPAVFVHEGRTCEFPR